MTSRFRISIDGRVIAYLTCLDRETAIAWAEQARELEAQEIEVEETT